MSRLYRYLRKTCRKATPLVIALLICRPSACAQQVTAQYTLTGTVINTVTGEPLRKTLVEVVGDTHHAVLTDQYGQFQVDGLKEMQATVMAEKPGFFDDQDLAPGPADQAQVHIGPFTKPLLVKMTPESIVVGRVTAANGEPLESVPVKLACVRFTNYGKRWEQCANTYTSEEGEFRFGSLMPGSYYVEAGPSSSYAVSSSVVSVDLVPGQQAEEDFTLQPDPQLELSDDVREYAAAQLATSDSHPSAAGEKVSRISGAVLNLQTGQPLPGAEVIIAVPQDRTPIGAAITGDNGRFSFARFSPGTYILLAKREGFRPQGRQTRQPFWTRVTVAGGQDCDNLIFQLQADSSLSGLITDEGNEAVRDAQVMLFRRVVRNGKQASHLEAESVTDSAGHYRFSHLEPGEYVAAVVAQPWYAQNRSAASSKPSDAPADLDVAYPIIFQSGATDPSDAVPISLQPGERVEADVTLRPVPAVHLRVRNASLDPARPGAATLMASLYGGFVAPVPTERTTINGGLIEINGVPPGRYAINLQSFGGEDSANRSREFYLSGDMEIDGNQI